MTNEQFAKALAERINGGSFYDPKYYTEEQRQLWIGHAKHLATLLLGTVNSSTHVSEPAIDIVTDSGIKHITARPY